VDDDEVYRQLMREAIETIGGGIEISVASDGMNALENLRTSPFDVLITDLNMPRMDGLNLLAWTRKAHPQILVIIITGYGSVQSAVEAIRQGAYDYIQKPLKLEQISVVARNAVERVKIQQEKAKLLNELGVAYQRLQLLESESQRIQSEEREALHDIIPHNDYPFIPYTVLPLSLLETPQEYSDKILAKLERLKELKRERVINEREFAALKRAIMDSLGSKEL